MIVALDHIQLALPKGAEDVMHEFYCGLLGLVEMEKPVPLRDRGGFWAAAGAVECHFGIDPDFHPATKAHPAFVIDALDTMAEHLAQAGFPVTWDDMLPDVRRCFISDPVGNRVELIAKNKC